MKRKILGIPVVVGVAIIALLAVGGGAVLGLFFFSQVNPGTVEIHGSGAALFEDAACTIPLAPSTVLDFGPVRNSSPSSAIPLYLKNEGSDDLFPVMHQNDLNSGLQLTEATRGIIGNDDVLLYDLATFDCTWGASDRIMAAMDDTQTFLQFTSFPLEGVATPENPWYLDVEGEYIKITGCAPDYATSMICDEIVRGYAYTTITSHAEGTLAVAGSIETLTPEVVLQMGEVLEIILQLEAAEDLTPYLLDIEDGWTVEISVTSGY